MANGRAKDINKGHRLLGCHTIVVNLRFLANGDPFTNLTFQFSQQNISQIVYEAIILELRGHVKLSKKKLYINKAVEAATAYHNQIVDMLKEAIAQLQCSTELNSILLPNPSATDIFLNNIAARAAAHFINNSNIWMQLCNDNVQHEDYKEIKIKDIQESKLNVVNRLVKNENDFSCIINIHDRDCVIPPKCQFLLSDIKNINLLTLEGTLYDVIIIDPPWKNKSVKRKREYTSLSTEILFQLPVVNLAAPNCLIFIWVTNKQHYHTFVKTELFPHWNVKYCADWHWLKVTQSGAPVNAIDNFHKRPYENLIIGQIQNSDSSLKEIPPHAILTSVPSSLHSHKLPLSEIITDYIPTNSKCLELFARNLLPGWTSWGNEVLKLQELRCFLTT